MNNRFNIVACGRIGFAVAGTPAWIGNHRGFNDAIIDNGVGDWTVSLEGAGYNEAQTAVLVTKDGIAVASQNTAYGVAAPTDIQRRITCVQEDAAGAPSVAADIPCTILVIAISPP